MANVGENNIEDEDNAPMSGLYENVPTTNIHLGAQSEITDFSADGLGATHSVVTDTSTRVTYDSDTPFNRSLRRSRYDLPSSGRSTPRSRSRSSRRRTQKSRPIHLGTHQTQLSNVDFVDLDTLCCDIRTPSLSVPCLCGEVDFVF
jgi:hypothetical protein